MVLDPILFSSKMTKWGTPHDLFKKYDDKFHFTLDAATEPTNPLGTPKFFTEKEDGLRQPWETWTWINPPYGRNSWKWVFKARWEQTQRNIGSVALLPARTDTRWFHRWVYNKSDVEIEFLRGRVKFVNFRYGDSATGLESAAPFPSMIVTFKTKM